MGMRKHNYVFALCLKDVDEMLAHGFGIGGAVCLGRFGRVQAWEGDDGCGGAEGVERVGEGGVEVGGVPYAGDDDGDDGGAGGGGHVFRFLS